MIKTLEHTTQITLIEKSATAIPNITATVTEPFTAGIAAPRLLFDFSVMASLLKSDILELPILDFGAGTGRLSIPLAGKNFEVTAVDPCFEMLCQGAEKTGRDEVTHCLLKDARLRGEQF